MRFWMTVAMVTGMALPVAAQDVTTPEAGSRSGPVASDPATSGPVLPDPVTPQGPDALAIPTAPATDGTSDAPATTAEADVSSLSMEDVIGRQLGAFNARDVDLA